MASGEGKSSWFRSNCALHLDDVWKSHDGRPIVSFCLIATLAYAAQLISHSCKRGVPFFNVFTSPSFTYCINVCAIPQPESWRRSPVEGLRMKHSLLPHQATPLQVLLTVHTMVKIAKRVLGFVWPTVVGLCPGTSETTKSCKFRRWTTAERVFHPVKGHPHQRRATKMDNSMARIKVTGERSV